MDIKIYVIDNWDKIIGVLIAYFSLVLPIFKYLQDKRKEERNKRFENYHKLIDDLVGGQPGKQVMLDRQIAIIFELRHFNEYFPVTLRILGSLKLTWANSDKRLLNELALTEKYINSSWFDRKFCFRE
ncbi:MAG: hypothetical protein IPL74_22500 [Bacteroidetes bacterium]|nr:hypothetical protein [Bacteroidota bacterium]